MNNILSSLYNCAIKNETQHYLTHSDFMDYNSAVRYKGEAEEKLNQLLEGELLRLFKLYQDNEQEAECLENISMFRKGLAIGLKLGAFCASDG